MRPDALSLPGQIVTKRRPDVGNYVLKVGERGDGAQRHDCDEKSVFDEVLAFAIIYQAFQHNFFRCCSARKEAARERPFPGVSLI